MTGTEGELTRWTVAVRRALEAGLLRSPLERTAEDVDRDADTSEVVALADAIREYVLDPGNFQEPYGVFWGDRARLPAQLTEDHLEVLRVLAAEADDWRLRVRALDVLLLRASGRHKAELAVRVLHAVGEALADTAPTSTDFDVIERAFALTRFGKDAKAAAAPIETAMVDWVLRAADELSQVSVAERLRHYRRGTARSAEIARHLEATGTATQVRELLEEAAEWFFIARDGDSAHKTLIQVVLDLTAEADTLLAQHRPDTAARAAHNLERALKTLSRVPRATREAHGQSGLADELFASIRKAGRSTLGLMRSRSHPLPDLRRIREPMLALVEQESAGTAQALFLHALPLNDFELAKADAEQIWEKSSFLLRIPSATYELDGRKVAASNPTRDPDVYGVPAGIWGQLLDTHRLRLLTLTTQVLAPMWVTLTNSHTLTLVDFIRIANRSPLVPPRRERQVGQALYYGYNGDFLSAAQLLSAQLESVVRYHLGNAGERTSQLDNGIENENGLSTLVKTESFEKVFDADIAFEIRALFCGDGGVNLRNRSAHGLIDDSEGEGAYCFYAWWLMWKLVDGTFGNTERDPEASANREAEEILVDETESDDTDPPHSPTS